MHRVRGAYNDITIRAFTVLKSIYEESKNDEVKFVNRLEKLIGAVVDDYKDNINKEDMEKFRLSCKNLHEQLSQKNSEREGMSFFSKFLDLIATLFGEDRKTKFLDEATKEFKRMVKEDLHR